MIIHSRGNALYANLPALEVRTVVVQTVQMAARILGLGARRAEAMAPGVPVEARSQPSRSKSLLLPTLSVHLTVFRGLTRLEEANIHHGYGPGVSCTSLRTSWSGPWWLIACAWENAANADRC